LVRAGRGASVSSRSAGSAGGRLSRICRLEDSAVTLLRLRFRGAPLFFRHPVGLVELFPDVLLGASRLGGLLRFGGCAPRGGRAGFGQAAAAEGGKQERKRNGVTHDCQFTRPDTLRKCGCDRGNIVYMPKETIRRASVVPEPRVRRGYFECRYGQLHVHHVMPGGGGFEEATALLCLHDLGASARVFSRFLTLVGRDRSAYAPDLPGCGESDPPPQPARPADYAAAIGDFLDSMRLRQIDVLGSRGGALLATELAATRPAQIRRVVLVSVPAGEPAVHYPWRERLASLSQRVLVLRVHDDLWDATARVREVLPAARLTELRDPGAEPFTSAPAEVAEAVLDFTRG
jgi:pimeloyl-ACP methyl ester carboxylesterase